MSLQEEIKQGSEKLQKQQNVTILKQIKRNIKAFYIHIPKPSKKNTKDNQNPSDLSQVFRYWD